MHPGREPGAAGGGSQGSSPAPPAAMLDDLLPGLRWKDWSFVPTSAPARRRNELGLNLLLFGYLGFTFAAALFAYAFLALRSTARAAEVLPWAFWASTVAVLTGGVCLRLTVRAVKRERQRRATRLVWAAFVCGALFALLQTWGLSRIVAEYHAIPAATKAITVNTNGVPTPLMVDVDGRAEPTVVLDPDAPVRTPLAGVVAMLVLLHGAHFVGGLLVLGVAAVRTARGRYDHEYHGGLTLASRYWTFLDVSWLIMLGTFAATM